MTTPLKKGLLAMCCAATLFGSVSSAQAANWLMLQGTEHPKMPDHRLFAFVQPAWSASTGADKLEGLIGAGAAANGSYAVPNTVTPDFDRTQSLYMRRARLGVRGRLSGPLKNSFTAKINYFGMLALDDGLFNQNQFDTDRRPVSLDHASLTFNHIPGARVRVGLFKNPSSEEIFQGVNTIDFIEFSTFGATQVLENFYSGNTTLIGNNPAPAAGNAIGTPQRSAYGFSAARDWGIQVFDSFKVANKSWDLSYAVKVGRGESISRGSDSDNNKELYLYASAEKLLPGGRGPKKNGVKMYAWHQSGERQFYTDTTDKEFDRTRYGVGVKGLGKFFGSKYKQRFAAELAYAKGMIFLGPVAGVAGQTGNGYVGTVQLATDDANKSRGLQFEYGFYLDKNWQFDIRWAREQRLYSVATGIDPGNERELDETTLGVTYHFTPKTRLTFNYGFRDVKQPNDYSAAFNGGNAGATAGANNNVPIVIDSIGDRIGLQLTWVF
ncbi:porin [Sulfuriflexus sp.]|uniref:porin n=1 Tax=Sulfuriflexus sp. TaxID=2015443 RepID=UPI0028CE17B3|nr:porin [Sulfuriflexus sp.]MDT8404711.1 porin [Sulfuriflexus sp.]